MPAFSSINDSFIQEFILFTGWGWKVGNNGEEKDCYLETMMAMLIVKKADIKHTVGGGDGGGRNKYYHEIWYVKVSALSLSLHTVGVCVCEKMLAVLYFDGGAEGGRVGRGEKHDAVPQSTRDCLCFLWGWIEVNFFSLLFFFWQWRVTLHSYPRFYSIW